MTSLAFLGTGNYLAPGRYWNSFVIDSRILVEPAPTVLPNLRRCGIGVETIDVIMVSHFHADHTFGWPFLLLELVRARQGRPLFVVGPPGVEQFLSDLMEAGYVRGVRDASESMLDMRFIEFDGTWQTAGSLRFRGIEVEHVPYLQCFGFLIDLDGRTIGYSGDSRPCPGLDELAGGSDVLVLECNGPHPPPASHMDVPDVRELRGRFPDVPFVLTHMGDEVDAEGIDKVIVPNDFDVFEV